MTPYYCTFCVAIGVLSMLIIQQMYWLDAELTKQRRSERKRKLSRRREPVFPVTDHRKVLLARFGVICRKLMADNGDRVWLRQQGDLILQELSA